MTSYDPPAPAAEIHDRGYRRYDGPRTGTLGATKTLVTHSAQRCLGLHRSARHKIIPFLVIGLAFVPAIIFVGLSVVIPSALASEVAPRFSGYFGYVSTFLFLFIAFVAPVLLSQDRRNGMLGIYLASPLDRTSYLAAKSVAITALMLPIALLPNLFYLVFVTIQGWGPDGIGVFVGVLVKMVVASLVIAVFFASVGMAMASATDRSGTATAIILGLFVGSDLLALALAEELRASHTYRLLALITLPIELAPRIFGEVRDWPVSENPTWTLWAAVLGIIVACQAFVWYRYQKVLVRR